MVMDLRCSAVSYSQVWLAAAVVCCVDPSSGSTMVVVLVRRGLRQGNYDDKT